MIPINSINLLRIAVVAILAILPTTGAPVEKLSKAEVSYSHYNKLQLLFNIQFQVLHL